MNPMSTTIAPTLPVAARTKPKPHSNSQKRAASNAHQRPYRVQASTVGEASPTDDRTRCFSPERTTPAKPNDRRSKAKPRSVRDTPRDSSFRSIQGCSVADALRDQA